MEHRGELWETGHGLIMLGRFYLVDHHHRLMAVLSVLQAAGLWICLAMLSLDAAPPANPHCPFPKQTMLGAGSKSSSEDGVSSNPFSGAAGAALPLRRPSPQF